MKAELMAMQANSKRDAVEVEAKQVEKRAFDRAFKNARKEVAKAEGTAAGIAAANGVDAPARAVEAARARALGGAKGLTPAPLEKATPAPSVQTVKLADGTVVPESYYELAPEDQQRLVQLVKQREAKQADDNLALNAVGQVLDQQDRDRAQVKALEGQVATLLGVVEAMQRRLDEKDNQLEIAKSEALAQQQVEVAQTATNLLTVKLQATAEMEEFNRLREVAAAESRAQLEAQATAIDALKGSVSSTTKLMEERGNAVFDQLATAEGRLGRLEVQLQALEGRALKQGGEG